MRKPRASLQLGHNINRHKAVIVFIGIRVISPQRCLGFARQPAGRFDADIFDQSFGMFFKIAIDTHHTPLTWQKTPDGEIAMPFPIIVIK